MYDFDSRIVSDLHKDARGYRPSIYWMEDWNNYPDGEKQRIWDGLCAELKEEMEREEASQKAAAVRFESDIVRIQELMNNSREDAIRVIIQAEDLEDDVQFYGYESLEWKYGLKFGYIKGTL